MEASRLKTGSEEWLKFLESHEHFIFHRPEYIEFIERTFPSVKAHYIGISEHNDLKAVFPFFHVSQPGLKKMMSKLFPSLFSEKIISCAFNDYGGPCGSLEEKYVTGLLSALQAMKNKFNVPYIELRQGLESSDAMFTDLPSQKNKRFVLPLTTKDAAWYGIQKYKRKAITKAKNAGVTTRELSETDLAEIYSPYSRNMREFGDPPYPKRFFVNFFTHFVHNGSGKIFGAFVEGKLAAVLLGYCCSNRVHIIIAVSEPRYLELRPNDAVHWHFIQWACDNGYKYFDFGNTREDSGQFEYKRKWAAS